MYISFNSEFRNSAMSLISETKNFTHLKKMNLSPILPY